MSFDPWETPPTIAVDGTARVLRWLRCFLNYSPEELAGYAGLRADVLERFEAGYHALPVHDLLRLSTVVRSHVHVRCVHLRRERREHAERWLENSERAMKAWRTRCERRPPPASPEEKRERANEATRRWRMREHLRMEAERQAASV
jgi:hypothetical protein